MWDDDVCPYRCVNCPFGECIYYDDEDWREMVGDDEYGLDECGPYDY